HIRYRASQGNGGVVDIQAQGIEQGRVGQGSVHHVAFRAADDAEQAAMARDLINDHGLHPTGQKDRQYFRSMYFHERCGVLFERATDPAGFTVVAPLADLGPSLKPPGFLQPRRKELERLLPSLDPNRWGRPPWITPMRSSRGLRHSCWWSEPNPSSA